MTVTARTLVQTLLQTRGPPAELPAVTRLRHLPHYPHTRSRHVRTSRRGSGRSLVSTSTRVTTLTLTAGKLWRKRRKCPGITKNRRSTRRGRWCGRTPDWREETGGNTGRVSQAGGCTGGTVTATPRTRVRSTTRETTGTPTASLTGTPGTTTRDLPPHITAGAGDPLTPPVQLTGRAEVFQTEELAGQALITTLPPDGTLRTPRPDTVTLLITRMKAQGGTTCHDISTLSSLS